MFSPLAVMMVSMFQMNPAQITLARKEIRLTSKSEITRTKDDVSKAMLCFLGNIWFSCSDNVLDYDIRLIMCIIVNHKETQT